MAGVGLCVPTWALGAHTTHSRTLLSIPEMPLRGPLPGEGRSRAAAQPAPASRPPQLTCLPSLNGPTVIQSRSPAARALRYAPRFLGALTTDGCYTRRVLLGHEQCVTHRNCATHPQDAPALGQLGRAPDCLPWAPVAVRGRLGRCLVAHRVSGAALCPGCAFTPVPAGSALPRTPSQAP